MLLLIISCLSSCRKSCSMGNMISGTYNGTLVRWLGKEGPVANVKITFTGDAFNGNSDSLNYPSICSGTFNTVSTDSIHFINQCDFLANFDWTLILNGSYKLIQTGDSLYFRRVIGDIIYEEDIYSLRKQ
jgi:hypothetical protein